MSERNKHNQRTGWRERMPLVGLVVIGLLSGLLYWQGIAAQYPLAQGLIKPGTTWARLVDFSLWAGARHAVVYILLTIGYVGALHLALHITHVQQRTAIAIIGVVWLLCSIILLAAYPGDSLDIFEYLFRGRMQVLFGASPLAVTPDAFRDQPFYANLTWGEWVDAYGPLWEYASGLVARTVGAVGAGRAEDYILGYRLWAIMLTGVSGVLIALIVRQHSPRHLSAALLAWFWNPLLLIATAVGAHNDGIMLVLILGAVLLFQRQHWLLGLIVFGLAAHTKITALLLLPVLGLWLLRQCGWRRTFGIGAVAVAIIVPVSWLLYAPLGGWATLPRMLQERHILTYNSLANVVFEFLIWSRGWDATDARQATIRGSELGFVLIAGGLLILFWWRTATRPLDSAVLWQASSVVLLMYLLVGCFWFQYWYASWVLVFAVLLPASRFTTVLMPCFTCGALCSNLVTNFLINDPARRVPWLQINRLMVATLFTPLICAIAILGLSYLLQRSLDASKRKRWATRST